MSGEQWGEAVPGEVFRAACSAYAKALPGFPADMLARDFERDAIGLRAAFAVVYAAGREAGVADTRRKVAEAIARAIEVARGDRCPECGGKAAFRRIDGARIGRGCGGGHVWQHPDRPWLNYDAAAIARGSGNGDSSGQEPEACASGTESDRDGRDPTDACRRMQ